MIATDDDVDNTGRGNETDTDNDNDDAGDNASSTTSDESLNCNRDNGKDACALTATTPAHRRW